MKSRTNPDKSMLNAGRGLKEVMTAQEVSAFLRIPLSTLYALTQRGKIRAVKVGKHWRYLGRDLEEQFRGNSEREDEALPVAQEAAASAPTVPSNGNPERRCHARINCEIHSMLIPALRFNVAPVRGVLQNLGEGGLFFAHVSSQNLLAIGDPALVLFEIPSLAEGHKGKTRKIEVYGRVIHREENGAAGMGIKFRALPCRDQEVIREYVG